MRALILKAPRTPLVPVDRPPPEPRGAEVLLRVRACGVCRTDLHVQDQEIEGVRYPVVPGHQAVGDVLVAGPDSVLPVGARVGVPWLAWACGECAYCRSGRENLCDRAQFTGCHRDGGFADLLLADSRFCLPLPADAPPDRTAPLLCAGLIGYRSLRLAGEGRRLGIYGFGAAAHLVAQVALHQGREVYAFTRPGDTGSQAFARSLGVTWAGGSDEAAPVPLDAGLIFAPDGALVPKALRDVAKGGAVICGGIHMSDIPAFPYADLWGERRLQSVANLTRADGVEFFRVAAAARLRTTITTYPLMEANRALDDLRRGALHGAAVLVME